MALSKLVDAAPLARPVPLTHTESTTSQGWVLALTSVALVRYASVTWCEDVTMSRVPAHGKPMALSTWRDCTGLSELPLLPPPAEWVHSVHVEPHAFRRCAQAVHAAADAYLADLELEPHGRRCHTQVLSALLLRMAAAYGELTPVMS